MSQAPTMRRSERQMSDDECFALLGNCFAGRVAVVDPDGNPYCVPLLYVVMDRTVYVHTAAVQGHFRRSIDNAPKVCFEVDSPGDVFDYGRFECDSGLEYCSVMMFGTLSVVEDPAVRQRFCDALLAKYRTSGPERPKSFYPRIDMIAIYALNLERMTGKRSALPAESERWPARDRTPTPNAQPA